MAKKKTGTSLKAKKASAPKKSKTTASSTAPYILIIMALLAGLLFLISLQSDSVKNIFGKKDPLSDEKSTVIVTKDARDEKKGIGTAEDEKKSMPDKELSPREKEKKEVKKETVMQAKVYFLMYNEKADKVVLVSGARTVSALMPVKSALEELVKGPSPNEDKKGYVSAIPPSVRVIDVSIVNNIAFINFSEKFEEGAVGHIMLNRLDQVMYTATQFENVEGIHILINGQRKRYLGSDGISIAGPLKPH